MTRVTTLLRRRRLVLIVAAVGMSFLVFLPLVGLWRIEATVNRSHGYVQLVTASNDLSRDLILMTTGELAFYGTDPSEANRAAAEAKLAGAHAEFAAIQGRLALATRLGIADAVTSHLEVVSTYLEAAESYLMEIAEGATIESSASAPAVITAATELLQNETGLATALPPVSGTLDEQRRAAVNNAQTLLLLATMVAVLTIGTLGVVDNRRVENVIEREATGREYAERVAAHRADVVSMASHELRNPLTVLTMTTDLLQREAAKQNDEVLLSLAEDARVSAVRCNMLVDELLDLGRLDADRLSMRMGVTPLLPSVQSAVEVSRSQHGPRTVQISGDPAATVHADPDRLKTIVRNLIDNAFKYSPDDSTIHINIAAGEEHVRLDVLDEGSGVPETHRETIFQRFERAPSTLNISGVGIGLFLSRELARKMDGELRCLPSDRGGEFELELRAAT